MPLAQNLPILRQHWRGYLHGSFAKRRVMQFYTFLFGKCDIIFRNDVQFNGLHSESNISFEYYDCK